ncbi:hypothetical protein GCM10009682_43610 [Luedemannella flava]|uniref:Uncharacterized protein n=1 Tax=Luedemannella flava TaxID=349316 RepID=A0ABP4YLY6_9ACTN
MDVCRFVQRDSDRREIYAIVTDGPAAGAHGPLDLTRISRRPFVTERPGYPFPTGDPALAESLAARAGEFHDLDDFYAHYGYPAEVLAWVASMPRHGDYYDDRGYRSAEVADRLGLDLTALNAAAWREAIDPGRVDPAGDPVFHPDFDVDRNWAVTGGSGPVMIDVTSYRFKAWLSFGDRP